MPVREVAPEEIMDYISKEEAERSDLPNVAPRKRVTFD
jgi:hypothetical protein